MTQNATCVQAWQVNLICVMNGGLQMYVSMPIHSLTNLFERNRLQTIAVSHNIV